MTGKAEIGCQQDDQPVEPDRKDNLWEPVPGDHGAHGRFDGQARRWSAQLFAARHRGWIAAGALALAAAGAAAMRKTGKDAA